MATSLKPKKQPVQERARATVNAILQAAAYILVKEGYVRLTTNRVAERAGVNIASLYQYFPNKEALVAELHRNHIEEVRAATQAAINGGRGGTLTEALHGIVRAGMAGHAVNPELHRIFADEMPRLSEGRLDAPDAGPVIDAIASLLRHFGHTEKDAPHRAWMVRIILSGIIHQAVADCPQRLASDELAEEIVLVLRSYLEAAHLQSVDAPP